MLCILHAGLLLYRQAVRQALLKNITIQCTVMSGSTARLLLERKHLGFGARLLHGVNHAVNVIYKSVLCCWPADPKP
jgi:hypothetical protein